MFFDVSEGGVEMQACLRLKYQGPAEIEATEAVIGGQKFLIVPAEALAGLYVAKPEQEAAPRKPRRVAAADRVAPKVAVRRKYTRKARVIESAPATGDSTVADQISSLLCKRPMTSGELVGAIRADSSFIYRTLARMRLEKDVETREDPADGQRKNFLVKAA